MSETIRQVVAVLFSDVKGFSKLSNDRLSLIVKAHLDEFIRTLLTPLNHCYRNTWGDGLLVCSYDPHDLLEIALKLNDWFSSKNWIREGFEKTLLLRIGLHMDKVTVIREGATVLDIDGKNVNKAARIEPVVEPGRIYCSQQFKELTEDDGKGFVQFVDLGQQELAKEFGTLHLFEVSKVGEARTASPAVDERPRSGPTLTGLRIRRDFSEEEKASYLRECYEQVYSYFQGAIPALKRMFPDLDVRFSRVRDDKFTFQVFLQGSKKAECQIWIGSSFGNGIHYAETISQHDNSFNDTFTVQSNGYELSLSSMGYSFSGRENTKPTKANIGELVWKRFQKNLER